jgi:hypothetical protein
MFLKNKLKNTLILNLSYQFKYPVQTKMVRVWNLWWSVLNDPALPSLFNVQVFKHNLHTLCKAEVTAKRKTVEQKSKGSSFKNFNEMVLWGKGGRGGQLLGPILLIHGTPLCVSWDVFWCCSESTTIPCKRGEYFNYLITPVLGHSFFVCENCERRWEGFALIIHIVVVRRSRSEQARRKSDKVPH